MKKLSISNIGWLPEQDAAVYQKMAAFGFMGLEIAPTRIFPDRPYDRLTEAKNWAESLKKEYGFAVPSMQSIWFGRQERIFGSSDERKALLDYTKKAIDFAAAISCGSLVFGCPRNRSIPAEMSREEAEAIAAAFFRELGDYAAEKGTVLAMEANPPIYNTNYINGTEEALDLVKQVASPGFKLNLDVGTMIQNGEPPAILKGNVPFISHVHISEPGLKPIEKRSLHGALLALLQEENYHGFVSIELGRQEVTAVENAMAYLKSLIESDVSYEV